MAVLSAFKKLHFDQKYDFGLIYQSIPDAVYNIMKAYNDDLISTIEKASRQVVEKRACLRTQSTVEELEQIKYSQSVYKAREGAFAEDSVA